MSPPPVPALEAERLRKEFGPLVAVADVTLAVAPGEIVGLVGPDGAGKTTTMRMLSGAMPPTSGTARVAGIDVVREVERARLGIGYMPQRFSLYPDLTVAENLRFSADIYGVPRRRQREQAARLLEFARLTPFVNRQAQHLSGGMRQKLMLAATLMHTPRVLLLDEPTTGVDPVSRREFWQILEGLLAEGVTVLVSTAYLDEAERCQRVALMAGGRLLQVDTPAAMRAGIRGGLVQVIVEPQREARRLLAALPGVLSVEAFGSRLHVWLQDPAHDQEPMVAALRQAGMQVAAVRPARASLEDVFVQAVAGREGGDG